MSDIATKLLNLLHKQLAGDAAAADQIASLSDQVCGEKIYRDHLLTSQQVRGVELLLEEWRGMFSFFPGRLDGLPHLVSLLGFIRRTPHVELLQIYNRREWEEIVDLRGPVETVQIIKCSKCRTLYPRMGMSGFLDLIDLYCGHCGDITFKPLYDNKTEAICRCGDITRVGCPNCRSIEGNTVEEMSPYKYFAKHRYIKAYS